MARLTVAYRERRKEKERGERRARCSSQKDQRYKEDWVTKVVGIYREGQPRPWGREG